MYLKTLLGALLSLITIVQISAHEIRRVEPLSWWVGMNTPLQVTFYGEDLAGADVSVSGQGVAVTRVYKADSPNYLFADVQISANAIPGQYTFTVSKDGVSRAIPYTIDKRREGSAARGSFSSADLIYLVMPDRFANGDPSNDTVEGVSEGVNRQDHFGRHGGDIRGIMDRLDYMADLGVTALWSTPMLLDDEPESSYHGYACADYYRIDPRYGSNELYREMAARAHSHGIKIIMDVVTNHCGTAHWWMSDLPFRDWTNNGTVYAPGNGMFSTVSDPNASKRDVAECVNTWFDTSMPDMNTANPFVLQYFKQAFVWWIEWADLDGLRVDTYPYNQKDAMADWTRSILAEYPNLNIVGECWTSSPSMVAYWDGGNANKDGFDSRLPSVMDFPLMDAIAAALPTDTKQWGEGVQKIYGTLANDFVYNDPRTLMTFLDNHDTWRFADLMGGDEKRIRLGITMMATMRGVPQLYYGTELGFRSADLEQGHGGARIDFPGGWPGDRVNLFDPAQRTQSQSRIFQHARTLLNWRKTSTAVHHGKTTHFVPRDNTYSYFRHDDRSAVFVLVNASETPMLIDWERYSEITGLLATEGRSVIDGKVVKIGEPLSVQPLESIVVEFELK